MGLLIALHLVSHGFAFEGVVQLRLHPTAAARWSIGDGVVLIDVWAEPGNDAGAGWAGAAKA